MPSPTPIYASPFPFITMIVITGIRVMGLTPMPYEACPLFFVQVPGPPALCLLCQYGSKWERAYRYAPTLGALREVGRIVL